MLLQRNKILGYHKKYEPKTTGLHFESYFSFFFFYKAKVLGFVFYKGV